MKSRYKVLHVFSGFGGGISSLILNLLENKTDKIMFDLVAFSYENGEKFVERIENTGSHCYTMPRPRLEGYKTFTNYIEHLLSSNHYDAIHCHISGWRMMVFHTIAKKNGIKTFAIHAHTTRYDSRIDRIPIIRFADEVINYYCSTSFFTCSDLAAEYTFSNRYLKKRTPILIPNGIDEEAFETYLSEKEIDDYKSEFNIANNIKVLLHVGRFSWPKNHEYLLEVMNDNSMAKEYVLLLVGDGERYEEIMKLAQEKNLLDRVRFCGRRTDIPKLMQFSDCVLLPSRNEGLPTVAIEAQAAGTPIVMSDNITTQCDMGAGLVSFLSLQDISQWRRTIIQKCENSKVDFKILDIIRDKGFTGKTAGQKYCEVLYEMINGK